MTALCAGGTSGQRFGTAAVVDYASGLLATLAAEFGSAWLIPLIPLAGLPPLVLATFCSSDPPAMPTFTQAEADALLNLTPGAAFVSGLPKLGAALQNIIWNDACQCTSGTYTAPTAPAQPAGSITVVTGSGSAVGQTLCAVDHSLPDNSSLPLGVTNMHAASFYGSPAVQLVRVHYSRQLHVQPDFHPQFYYQIDNGPGAIRVNLPTMVADNVLRTIDIPVPAGHSGIAVLIDTGMLGPRDDTFVCWFEDFCGPGVGAPGCCGADLATSATLQHILALVTDMQRNYMPFAYVLGAVHAGLTGTGSVPVSRLLGVKVALTTIPGGAVTLPGNPGYIKDMGWMSVSEVDGMIQERRISQAAFTWFPPYMPLADHINYFLDPGVVATFTEISPEA
jgi:hypothetical protein